MPFRISGGAVRLITVALREPFITALGRKDATTNAVVVVRLTGGASGRGEASGSVVLAHQRPARLAMAMSALLKRFHGRDARAIGPLARETWERCGALPAAAAAFECAVTEALLAGLGVRMSEWFGGASRRIETDLTLSAAPATATAAAARRAARAGFRKLKVKVGVGGLREDLARVLAADAAGRAGGKRPLLLIDGNQGLGVSGALRLLDACLGAGLRVALIEQPVPKGALRALAAIKRRSPVPVAADESVQTARDALRLLDADAADIFNLKIAKSGLQGCLDIMAVAKAAGKKLMIGCMQETARGLSPSVHLACGSGAFAFADLDSDALLVEDQPRGDFRRDGAFLSL